jgi:GntR family transcriptional regulator
VGTPVVRFTRLRTGSGEPMAVETVCIPAATVPDLAPADLDGSLYALLAARYRLAPGSAAVTIEPVIPDAETQALLSIPATQACLRLRMTDSDVRGRPLMTADCVYRGDRYQLSAEVTGPGSGAGAAARAADGSGMTTLRARRAG